MSEFQYDKAYFDRHFSSNAYRKFMKRRNRFIHDEVTKHVQSGRMLDLGFGDDNLVRFFQDDFEVYGTDIASNALERLPAGYDRRHFKIANIDKEDIPFPDRFDVVCSVNTVEHLADPRTVLRRVHASLNDNGIFAVYLPTQSNLLSRIQYRFFYDVAEHIYRPSISELEKLLTGIGFRRCSRFNGTFLPFRVSPGWLLESLNLYLGVWQKAALNADSRA